MSSPDRQSPSFWHERFLQQARWTHAIRRQLFDKLKIDQLGPILEVGSGTGVIVKELAQLSSSAIMGLDIDNKRLRFAREYAPECLAIGGDGKALPFKENYFAACICHFLLLWVKEPSVIVQEMVRSTRPNGWIMALAEPDYGGRVDHPSMLQELGLWQTQSLESQGANPQIGRRLRTLFLDAGLFEIQVGVLGGQWIQEPHSDQSLEKEWSIMLSDLAHLPDSPDLRPFKSAWQDPGRVLYIPTFYAIGQVPG